MDWSPIATEQQDGDWEQVWGDVSGTISPPRPGRLDAPTGHRQLGFWDGPGLRRVRRTEMGISKIKVLLSGKCAVCRSTINQELRNVPQEIRFLRCEFC